MTKNKEILIIANGNSIINYEHSNYINNFSTVARINNFQVKKEHLFSKEGFKGQHGEFFIENNIAKQKLAIYKISNKKFVKVF